MNKQKSIVLMDTAKQTDIGIIRMERKRVLISEIMGTPCQI